MRNADVFDLAGIKTRETPLPGGFGCVITATTTQLRAALCRPLQPRGLQRVLRGKIYSMLLVRRQRAASR